MFKRMHLQTHRTRWLSAHLVNRWRLIVCLSPTMCCAGALYAQTLERQVRVEVRDRSGNAVPGARIAFLASGDSIVTDSLGIATTTVDADSSMSVNIRKIGYEPRAARFTIGRAPAFIIRVTLGALGQRLPEVSVTAEYPGESWRRGYEDRKRRASGSFRDRAFFSGREPVALNDWFNGLPGVQLTSRGLRVNRCARLGVWVDGVHLTGPGLSQGVALQQLTPTDIAALELYRTSQQQAQFSDPNVEDCSLVVWTRTR